MHTVEWVLILVAALLCLFAVARVLNAHEGRTATHDGVILIGIAGMIADCMLLIRFFPWS